MNLTLYKQWKERPMSWSQISSFEYSPEQWYKNYFLRDRDKESAEMIFGKIIGEKMANDRTFLPDIKRHDVSEHPFKVMFGNIPLVGYADFFDSVTRKKIQELKTGVKPWDQKRVDSHGQLDMYCFMHYITEKIKPEDVELQLIWLPTKRVEKGDFEIKITLIEPVEPKIFNTKRTMTDILNFGSRIKTTIQAMEEYIKTVDNHDL